MNLKNSGQTILILAKGYLPDDGGIERYSTELARAYQNFYARVYVITQTTAGPRVHRSGRVIIIDVGTASQFKVFMRIFVRLRMLLTRIKPNFIHATTWRISLPAFLLRNKIPLAITIHGREVFVLPKPLYPLMKFALKHADAVAVVSKQIEDVIRPTITPSKTKWMVLWNGLSFYDDARTTPARCNNDASPLRLYAFCRLVERKNMYGTLQAILLLRDRGVSNFHLDLAGDGPERKRLDAFVERHQLENLVSFLGRIPDKEITPRYKAADIFVHPQITAEGGKDIEGFGLTIADAMSFGLAVVAGVAGGPSDFVTNGKTGLLVNGENTVEIADALQNLIENTKLRHSIGRQGRDWALKELSWKKVAYSLSAELDPNFSKHNPNNIY